MKLLARQFYLLSILLLGTQVISLPGLPFSLFQLSLILTCIISILSIRKLKKGVFLWTFVILYAISSFMAYRISINPNALSPFLLSLMTVFAIVLASHLFDRRDINLLAKTLIRSQYIVIPFAVYSFIMFYYFGGLPEEISFPAGMSIELEKEALLRGQAGGQLRLMLPYSTSPMLSVVMSMCVVILFSNRELFSSPIRALLVIIFSVILVLTGSRTGMLSLFLFCGMHVFFNIRSLPRWTLPVIVVVALLITALILVSSDVVYLEKYFERFTRLGNEDYEQDRHLLVPLDGILIWLSKIRYFLIGIGLTSSAMLQGPHTFLPPHFLNSYVTLIAERGIPGLILAIMLIVLGGRLYAKRRRMTPSERSLSYSFIVALISFMFYECLNCYFVVFVIAVLFMLDRSINSPMHKMVNNK